MKLRMQDSSVRLRLSRPEVERIGRGVRVLSRASFPNGQLFSYALCVTAGDTVTARYDDDCVEVLLPRAIAAAWATGDDVSIAAELPVPNGTFRILVEKDFTCLHPREGEPPVESFPNPRAALVSGDPPSPPMERK